MEGRHLGVGSVEFRDGLDMRSEVDVDEKNASPFFNLS